MNEHKRKLLNSGKYRIIKLEEQSQLELMNQEKNIKNKISNNEHAKTLTLMRTNKKRLGK